MKHLWLIGGMALVTYIPRLAPFLALSERKLSPAFRRFLRFIPYTALGALIIPGALEAIPGRPGAAFIGLCVAAVSAWLNGGMIASVLASVITVFVILGFGAG